MVQTQGVRTLQAGNVFVQPFNRGTAIGILYSLLHVLNKDSEALVVLLPADHYVDAAGTLATALRAATERVERNAEQIVLLGMEPAEADAELGYILPGTVDSSGGRTVARFVEKPSVSQAHEIIAQGGLWNTFILAASARTLLNLFMSRFAATVVEMHLHLSRYLTSRQHDPAPLMGLYERLPYLDFSRDVLEDPRAPLCVLRVPSCGWSDLGTPNRIAQTLGRMTAVRVSTDERDVASTNYLSLAHQYHRLGLPQQHAGYGKA